MALKGIIDKLEDVAEPLREHYVADTTEGSPTKGKFKLAADGYVPKEKLDEFRTNNIELMRQNDELKGIKVKYEGVDIEEYKRLREEAQRVKDKKLIDAGKVDELVEERVKTLRDDLTGKLTAAESKSTALQGRLEVLLIDREIITAATPVCEAATLEDVIRRGREVFKLEGDKVVPRDKEGKIIYGSDAVTPLTITEWLSQLAGKAPNLFKQSAGGGAGGSGGDGGGGGAVTKKSELKDAKAKSDYISKHGSDAYLRLPA